MEHSQIKPGFFARVAAADQERMNYDARNGQLLARGLHPDLLFIGDSITQYWDVNLHFGRPGVLVINRGIAGDVPEIVYKRFVADVLQLQPRICVCLVGINVAMDLQSLPDTQESQYIVRDRILDGLRKIIALSMENKLNLYVGSLTSTCCPVEAFDARRNAVVPLVNEQLRPCCEAAGVRYVDYEAALYDPRRGTIRAEYTRDGLHPNAAGYAVMAQVLERASNGEIRRNVL